MYLYLTAPVYVSTITTKVTQMALNGVKVKIKCTSNIWMYRRFSRNTRPAGVLFFVAPLVSVWRGCMLTWWPKNQCVTSYLIRLYFSKPSTTGKILSLHNLPVELPPERFEHKISKKQNVWVCVLTTELNEVLMIPGATLFTLMLLWASSGARFWVRPCRAVLLTQ